jgi:hypothetical protein
VTALTYAEHYVHAYTLIQGRTLTLEIQSMLVDILLRLSRPDLADATAAAMQCTNEDHVITHLAHASVALARGAAGSASAQSHLEDVADCARS